MNDFLTNINIRPTSSRFSKCLISVYIRSLPPSSPSPPTSAWTAPPTLLRCGYISCVSIRREQRPLAPAKRPGSSASSQRPHGGHHSTRTVCTKGSLILLDSFSGVGTLKQLRTMLGFGSTPRKLTHLIQSFENSVQTSLRVL